MLDKEKNCPAANCATSFVNGDPLDFDDVYNFGKSVDTLTFEIENVNVEALKKLKREGKIIHPDPDVLEIIQDKGLQKRFYEEHNIQTSAFQLFDDKFAIEEALKSGMLRFPFVQKLRKGGYDGKGVSVIKTEQDLNNLLEGASVIENLVDIGKEISIIVATKIVSEFKFCGILAVEIFVDKHEKIWINEIAPRPHNSGHHTIDSVVTSQYEQLLRAIFNFPLGSTELKQPAVMLNLLGEPGYSGLAKYEGLTECMAIEGVKIHLYGKTETKPFRKMGHITVLANTVAHAKRKADFVKMKLKIKS